MVGVDFLTDVLGYVILVAAFLTTTFHFAAVDDNAGWKCDLKEPKVKLGIRKSMEFRG